MDENAPQNVSKVKDKQYKAELSVRLNLFGFLDVNCSKFHLSLSDVRALKCCRPHRVAGNFIPAG